MATAAETYRQKLKELLRELFQFDSADLDFGIYAILNQRREQIEHFIEHDLLEAVLDGLEIERTAQSSITQEELEQARQQLVNTVGRQALDPYGNVVELYKQASFLELPVVRQAVTGYETAKSAYETGQLEAETEAHIYNDLYRFFARYYDDGDFISQRRFGPDRYALPYNGQEVYLHWANADQYYIKTGERFSNYTFTLPATISDQNAEVVFFRLQKAETDRDNTKSSDKRFFVLNPETPYQWDESSRVLTLNFEYRALTLAEHERMGSRNQQDKLNEEAVQTLARTLPHPYLKAQLLQPDRSDGDRSRFIRHLHRYTARHTRDYFIHKNLAPFLRQELDYFLTKEVLSLDDLDMKNPVRARLALARVRVIRHIAHYIIAFLAQIENFQKRLFEKRKFVVQSDYCLTLDRIPEAVRDELYAALLHSEPQLQAWRELYALDQTKPTLFNPNGDLTGITEEFLKLYPYLMLDTAYLEPDLKAKLLAAFDNLDAGVDGLLIHSENFQALNLLLPHYRNQIKCIYIDPPYNTGNDEFIYKDTFQHSSWLAMMENRLHLAHQLLSDDGVIFVSLDDREQPNLRLLLDTIFGSENFIACVIWQKVFSPKNTAKYFSEDHDFLLVYTKDSSVWRPTLLPRGEGAEARYKNPDNDSRGPWSSSDLTARNYYSEGQYEVTSPSGKKFRPTIGTYWRIKYEKFLGLDKDNRIWWGEDGGNMPRLKRFLSDVKGGVTPQTLWKYEDVGHTQEAKRELVSFVTFERSEDVLNTVKPTKLVRRVLQIGTTSENDLVLDFFAGSGVTAHSVIQQNVADNGQRKYILVEMGDYFDNITRQRIMRACYAAEWRNGLPVEGSEGQSHMFHYLRLESYDDTLSNIVFKDRLRQPSLFDLLDKLPDYRLHYMLDFETEESPVLLNPAYFSRPFDYHLQAQPVDLVTTFNFLLGLRLETQWEFTWETGRVVRVVGLNPQGQRVCVIWRNVPEFSQLEAERAWLQSQVLTGLKVNLLFINGESLLPGAQPLEPEFQRLMFVSVTPTPPVEVN